MESAFIDINGDPNETGLLGGVVLDNEVTTFEVGSCDQ